MLNPAAADERRARIWQMLGGAPSHPARLVHRQTEQSPFPGATLERLTLDLNGVEPVQAFHLRPAGARSPPLVIYAHAHGNRYDLGKSEVLLGRAALQPEPYGKALTARGYAVLAIDSWLFEERQRPEGENGLVKRRLLAGDTVWGMMLRDTCGTIDLAKADLDIDAGRIAILGLSMGASMAWWSAALDPRIKICIDLCCMTDFASAIATGGIDGHGFYYSVPGLLREFSTASINALICPRPHLSLNGRFDPLTPENGLHIVDAEMRKLYAGAGVAGAWRMEIHDCGHEETPEMRRSALEFLASRL